ncbi:MAG: hypothetical protein AAFV07_13770, partial [Bacteroidota bacterium]
MRQKFASGAYFFGRSSDPGYAIGSESGVPPSPFPNAQLSWMSASGTGLAHYPRPGPQAQTMAPPLIAPPDHPTLSRANA